MNNFIKLSELKEKRLKEEEMRRVKGGEKVSAAIIQVIEPPPMVLHYGVIPDPYDPYDPYDPNNPSTKYD